MTTLLGKGRTLKEHIFLFLFHVLELSCMATSSNKETHLPLTSPFARREMSPRLSGLLFINRGSLATTAPSGPTHSAAPNGLPVRTRQAEGKARMRHLQVQRPWAGALACKEHVFPLDHSRSLQDTDGPTFRYPARVPQQCLQHTCNVQSQTWSALPGQPGRPSSPHLRL